MDILFTLIHNMVLAAISAVGFALVFNVPAKLLKYCAFLGAIGHGTRYLLITNGLIIEWSTLLASMLIGTLAIHFSRKFEAHPKVVSVAAVIPMIPGVSAYTAMISLVQLSHVGYSPELMGILVTHFLKAAFIVCSLSLGLSLPGIWIYRRRPSV
ncbi:threonine/serine exporter family protein [Neisseria sp. Ec49-e6-T10]|uniref:threonine/serine exporter family protein n=1 Tax=Neisseria sp. Ec49-e6-T10 TaxID=3140744 RepID=UPI003EB8E107